MDKALDLYRTVLRLASDPQQTRWVLPLVLLTDAALTALIVWKVPYTEIDFATYMEQVRVFLKGTHDYTLLEGPTGPCVYPAGHVYIYSVLYRLTQEGANIAHAQVIFTGVYMITLGVVGLVYRGCKAPPYIFPLLILSKRLHSIFVLRLFNDCFAVFFLFVAVALYQRRMWTVGSIALSAGVSVKMSLLLAVPGVLVVMGQAMHSRRSIIQINIMALVQLYVAFPFIRANRDGYFSRAFEFTRQFLFKWTVNWRFVGEETFLSKGFSSFLLGSHALILVVFAFTRWLKPADMPVPTLIRRVLFSFPPDLEKQINARLTPTFITSTIFTSMAIGMLCARSLHYQFYAYIAWATPLLLWNANFHPILIYAVWVAQEWSWNVFPSTDVSSMVVVGTLAIQVFGVWWGTRNEFAPTVSHTGDKKHVHVE